MKSQVPKEAKCVDYSKKTKVHIWNARRTEHIAIPILRDLVKRWEPAWKSNASVFYHPQHDMVHGDDFLALGDQKHLSELQL